MPATNACLVYAILVLGIIQYLPYFVSIRRGITRPSVSGWLVCSFSLLLIVVSSVAEGFYSALFIGSAGLLCQLIIVGWSVRLRINISFSRLETTLITVSVVSVVLWWLSDDPALALVINVAVDAIGTFLIARKTFHHPGTEDSLTWFIGILAAALNLAVFFDYSVKNLLFPVYLLVANSAIFLLSMRRRQTC